MRPRLCPATWRRLHPTKASTVATALNSTFCRNQSCVVTWCCCRVVRTPMTAAIVLSRASTSCSRSNEMD